MSSSQNISAQEEAIMYLLRSMQSQTPIISALDAGIAFLNHEQFLGTRFGFRLCNCRFESNVLPFDNYWVQLDGTECRHTPCGKVRSLCRCDINWSITFEELGELEPSTPPLNTAQQRQQQREEREEREEMLNRCSDEETNK